MSIKVTQKLVPPSKYSIKCPYQMNAEYITIHNTANSATADAEASYHNSNNNQVSYHFAIDDKGVIQVVPLNRNAWHCGDGNGDGNRKSIGIEICYSKSGGARYDKAEELAAQFTAQLLHERGWNIDRVRTHQSWSNKYCPHRILDKKDGWKNFLNRVQKALNELKSPTPPTNKSITDLNVSELTFTSSTLKREFEDKIALASIHKVIDNLAVSELKHSSKLKNGRLTQGDLLSESMLLALSIEVK